MKMDIALVDIYLVFRISVGNNDVKYLKNRLKIVDRNEFNVKSFELSS